MMTMKGQTSQEQQPRRLALVDYPPSQRYMINILLECFRKLLPNWEIATVKESVGRLPDLQWSDYDEMDFDAVKDPRRMLSSYVIRKSLIRKNHLAHTISMHCAKHPQSILVHAIPRTWSFTLAFSDELDELLQDDLHELGQEFRLIDEEGGSVVPKWWILKAALADRGNGIRLFSTRQELEEIFEEFEVEDSDDEDDVEDTKYGQGKNTAVDSSQMREWIVQEYISKPLLLDPSPLGFSLGRKFHLRVYVLAAGALSVHVHHPFLALFAPTPYIFPPTFTKHGKVDLSSHLTNTCLQRTEDEGPASSTVVALLSNLSDHIILGDSPFAGEKLGEERVRQMEEDVGLIVAETFSSGIASGSGLQVLPNCFEIFGLDFLVDDRLQVSLLEVNACPDYGQTGEDLQYVIATLFESTMKTAIIPFFDAQSQQQQPCDDDGNDDVKGLGKVDLDGNGLREVLRVEVSRGW